jgi:hypothetical protein
MLSSVHLSNVSPRICISLGFEYTIRFILHLLFLVCFITQFYSHIANSYLNLPHTPESPFPQHVTHGVDNGYLKAQSQRCGSWTHGKAPCDALAVVNPSR